LVIVGNVVASLDRVTSFFIISVATSFYGTFSPCNPFFFFFFFYGTGIHVGSPVSLED